MRKRQTKNASYVRYAVYIHIDLEISVTFILTPVGIYNDFVNE